MRFLSLVFLIFSYTSFAQVPAGYYDSASGLTGQQLRAALQDIIDGHTEQTYASLWTHFQSTDDKANGEVWDMYSDIPGGNPAYTYSFVIDQCGNYGAEGDCYNREHSFPKSWFDDAAPMLTDLFQIYPTDGYVNGKRSNYPYGEITTATWTSTNDSKLGNSSFSGYTGVVFEPIDEYKGDLARTYFYMMTRYMSLVSSWSSPMLSGNDLAVWAREMLLEWNVSDPVSQKEIDRNNAVYQIQNNRNPFIDNPEFTVQIWGLPSGIDHPELQAAKVWYSGSNLYVESNTFIECHLDVYNQLGQTVFSKQINSEQCHFPVTLGSGLYLVTLKSGKGAGSFKLIVAN